jgi:hypothetical protein
VVVGVPDFELASGHDAARDAEDAIAERLANEVLDPEVAILENCTRAALILVSTVESQKGPQGDTGGTLLLPTVLNGHVDGIDRIDLPVIGQGHLGAKDGPGMIAMEPIETHHPGMERAAGRESVASPDGPPILSAMAPAIGTGVDAHGAPEAPEPIAHARSDIG